MQKKTIRPRVLRLTMGVSLALQLISSPYSAYAGRTEFPLKCVTALNQTIPLVDPYSQEIQEVPGRVKSFFTGKLKQRKQIIQSNAQIQQARETLEKAKSENQNAVAKFRAMLNESRNGIHPKLKANFEQKLISVTDTVEHDIDPAHINDLSLKLESEFAVYYNTSRKLATQVQLTNQTITKTLQTAPKGFATPLHLEEIASIQKSLTESANEEELSQLSLTSIQLVEKMIEDYKTKIKLQRSKEKRFDVNVPENSALILESFIGQSKDLESQEFHEFLIKNVRSLQTGMTNHIELRQLIYQELQILRRLKASSKPTTREALALRLENDKEILKRFVEQGNQKGLITVREALGLRTALRKFISPVAFNKIVPKGSLKKMTFRHREKILRDALALPELAITIVGSSVANLEVPAKPIQPTRPDKPVKPTIYSYESKYAKKAKKERYKSAQLTFKHKMAQFKSDLITYKTKKAEYVDKLQKARALELRRNGMKESFAAYVMKVHPDLIAQVKASNNQRINIAENLNARVEKKMEHRRARLSPSRISQFNSSFQNRDHHFSNGSSIYRPNDDFHHWMMMFYTDNPMWLISPDIARIQLYMDLLTPSSSNIVHQDLAQGIYLDSGIQPMPLAESEQYVQTYMDQNQEAALEYQNLMNEMKTDSAEYGLGGVNIKEVAESEWQGSFESDNTTLDELSIIENEIEQSTEGDTTIVENDAQWGDFVAEGADLDTVEDNLDQTTVDENDDQWTDDTAVDDSTDTDISNSDES